MIGLVHMRKVKAVNKMSSVRRFVTSGGSGEVIVCRWVCGWLHLVIGGLASCHSQHLAGVGMLVGVGVVRMGYEGWKRLVGFGFDGVNGASLWVGIHPDRLG